jgi:hypothetical protein
MTPPQLFLSFLGSCSAYYAAGERLLEEDLEIRISAVNGDNPARIPPCGSMLSHRDDPTSSGRFTSRRGCLPHYENVAQTSPYGSACRCVD